MTKVKDIFKEVFIGYNFSNNSKNSKRQTVYTFKKGNIKKGTLVYNFRYNKETEFRHYEFRRYRDIFISNLIKTTVPSDIKMKYYLKPWNIVISLKKPYIVACDFNIYGIVPDNNFIVLREYNSREWFSPFVAYYIESVGIPKLLENITKMNTELTKEDILEIDIPDIPFEEQQNRYKKILNLNRDIVNKQKEIDELLNI